MKSRGHRPGNVQLSPLKRRLFIFITFISPVLLVAGLEMGLLIFNYGQDVSLFTKETIAGRTFCIMNPDVKWRYFHNVPFSPNTSPDYFEVPKPAGTFRIFCLGGSTTVGFPYGFIGSFSTFLRDRLKRLFPEKNVEVINLGMTATNSYTVHDIASELVNYEPDLFCVYDGHNEFYGALGIASRESVGSARWMTRVYLHLVHFRTFLLLRNAYGAVASVFKEQGYGEPAGTMMERLARGRYIEYRSDEYNTALTNFKANLNELRSLCTDNGIYLLVASQVCNLRDQSPFVSQNITGWTQAQRLKFHLTYNRGIAHLLNGMPDSALREFDAANVLDPLRADVHFQRARCLDSLMRKEEARQEYEKARDYDMLRFRTSSDFNNVIREMDDGRHVFFVDMERKFRSNSPDSLIGNNLILEHLHPNARGYFLMAKEFSWAMHLNGLLADRNTWNERDNLDDDILWSERPLTELDTLCARRRTDILTSGWPFRSDTRPLQYPPAPDTLEAIAADMVSGEMTWEQGHVAAATFFEQRGQLDKTEKEYKALINQIPLNVSAYLLLGRLYMRAGMNMEAAEILFTSTRIEETFFANRALGILALEPKDAISFFEKALTLGTATNEMTETGFLLADAYHRDGRPDRAIDNLHQVLQWTPGYVPAQRLLSQIKSRKQ